MHDGKWLARQNGLAEIVDAQAGIYHFRPEALLRLDPPRMSYPLAHHIADPALFQIDEKRASSAEFSTPVFGKPALGNFNDQVGALLSIGSDAPDGPHGMDFEFA